jgi:hypothetical protein
MIGKKFYIRLDQLDAILADLGRLKRDYKTPKARIQTNNPNVLFEIEHLEKDITRIDSLKRNCVNGRLEIVVLSRTGAQNIEQYSHQFGGNGTYIVVVQNPRLGGINFFPY